MKLQKRLSLRKKFRARRTRAKILGTSQRPRFSVFRSNNFIYAQLIDDENQRTLASASDKDLINGRGEKRLSKTERAKELGRLIAEKTEQLKIKTAVFDKGRYRYHGRVKAVADGAREAGLKF